MKRPWKQWWFWLAVLVLGSGLGLLAFCWTHRIWSWDEWRVYQLMERECHPAWRDYHYERVRAGDSVEDVIALTDPVTVKREGRWVVLRYQGGGLQFTGLAAVAYDDRMVAAYAYSCTWTRRFFDTMSPEQCQEIYGRPYYPPPPAGHLFVR